MKFYEARLREYLLNGKGLPSDSTCILAAEPGKLDINRPELGPEVIKLFCVLNSTEHEIYLLIHIKMPTIVGILTFISTINT